MCDACGAEAAFVNVVMQDTVPSGSGAYLDHESMTEFGPPESQKENITSNFPQGPNAQHGAKGTNTTQFSFEYHQGPGPFI